MRLRPAAHLGWLCRGAPTIVLRHYGAVRARACGPFPGMDLARAPPATSPHSGPGPPPAGPPAWVASKSIARAFPAIAGSPWGQGASGRPYWGIKPPAESRGIRRGASEGAPAHRLQSASPPCASPSACTPLAIRPWPSARRRPRSAWRGRACCRTSQARCPPRACDWLHVEGQLQASRSALCSSGGRAHGLPASGHTFRNLID